MAGCPDATDYCHTSRRYVPLAVDPVERQTVCTCAGGTVGTGVFQAATLQLPIAEIRTLIRGRMIEQKFIHAHYPHVDGTSFAAPIVASLVAQMLEANPALSPAQ